MALLLLEPKPSLERKVKDGGPGDSDLWAASQVGFPEAGPFPQRHRECSLRLPLFLRPLPLCDVIYSQIPGQPCPHPPD